MSNADPLVPLLAALRDLSAWLQDRHVPGAVIGGVAASLLGRPRTTRDVDAVVLLDAGRWKEFLAAGKQFGFVPRRTDVLTFAEQARVLLVHHEQSHIDVDIAFGALSFEQEVIARVQWVEVGNIRVPLVTPEDLIIMKAVAHRPRDLADIEAVLDAQSKLDLRRVRRWVREFSKALNTPDILSDLESVLSQYRKRRK